MPFTLKDQLIFPYMKTTKPSNGSLAMSSFFLNEAINQAWLAYGNPNGYNLLSSENGVSDTALTIPVLISPSTKYGVFGFLCAKDTSDAASIGSIHVIGVSNSGITNIPVTDIKGKQTADWRFTDGDPEYTPPGGPSMVELHPVVSDTWRTVDVLITIDPGVTVYTIAFTEVPPTELVAT